MDLRPDPDDEAFRNGLRTWLTDALATLPPPPARDDWPARRAYDTAWQRRLHDAGYAGLGWPREHGGQDRPPGQQLIFWEECARAGAPYVGVNFVGLLHAGPTLIAEGTPAQQATHLPRILAGEEVWCQGFSEPEAGSDLAALRTRARRHGDRYVVRGHKIWCSFAQVADYCELLVRTDPDAPKHRGLTWLILPMDRPGITIRPIRTVLGSSEFCELFLDDVEVPVENRVGAENDGWRVTQVTLAFERGTAFVSELVDARRLARTLAGRVGDEGLRRELGLVAAELDACWALTKRTVSQAALGRAGAPAMVMKLAYSEARQRLGELSLRILGDDALEVSPIVEERLRTLALPIAAGTSQIQRNIIAERLLGLPRESR